MADVKQANFWGGDLDEVFILLNVEWVGLVLLWDCLCISGLLATKFHILNQQWTARALIIFYAESLDALTNLEDNLWIILEEQVPDSQLLELVFIIE